MELTIKSRKLNETFTFWKSNGKNQYVYLVMDSRPGTLGQQICRNGSFSGDTLSASDERFVAVCKSWYRSHVKTRN